MRCWGDYCPAGPWEPDVAGMAQLAAFPATVGDHHRKLRPGPTAAAAPAPAALAAAGDRPGERAGLSVQPDQPPSGRGDQAGLDGGTRRSRLSASTAPTSSRSTP